MATMAENCMTHLELMKEKEDLRRIKSMNMCLAAFVDPENRNRRRRRRITQPQSRADSVPQSNPSAPRSPASATGSEASAIKKSYTDTSPEEEPQRTQDAETAEMESISGRSVEQMSLHSSEHNSAITVSEDDPSVIIRNAMGLLFNSLTLDSKSGIVFLDPGVSLTNLSNDKTSSDESNDDGAITARETSTRGSAGRATHVSYRSGAGSMSLHDKSDYTIQHQTPSDIIAASPHSSSSAEPQFTPLSQYDLARLIKKYPRGMLFNVEEGDMISSSSAEEDIKQAYQMPKRKDADLTQADINLLRNHFPNSRHIVFLPFWNTAWSRYSAFMAFNTSPYRNFEKRPDFLHCIAFCHCITTELSRTATLAADHQKSDFIGSVSHELRSPLHGILASCEFLEDTSLSTFQKSLVDTADGCARTLLDTINMVLDYSKVNALERKVTKTRRSSHHRNLLSTAHLQPALSIYGDVDLAAITEEVVEGVATGQAFKDKLANVDVADITDSGQMPDILKRRSGTVGIPDVEIFLDIIPRNWTYLTQPGAFRRVVMNVFGNSIKYTSRGFIRVKLEAHPAPKNEQESKQIEVVTLIIKDTGQGISPQYMKTKLFTPFAQESSLAPGTGLGLSLVRSIVKILNGDIDIQSTVGVGTTVTIKFPMVVGRQTGSSTSLFTPPSSGGIERSKDDSLKVLQRRAKGRTAHYFTSKGSDPQEESTRLMRDVINTYLGQWYGFTVIESLSVNNQVDIIIVSQADFPELVALLASLFVSSGMPMVVVICAAGPWKNDRTDFLTRSTESISYPFGPYKLAKILKLCLDKVSGSSAEEEPGKPTSPQISRDTRDEMAEVVQAVQEVNLAPDVKVVQQGQMMANEEFAPLMMEALSSQSNCSIEQASGFPFPPAAEITPLASPPSVSAQDQPTHVPQQGTFTETAPIISRPESNTTTASSSIIGNPLATPSLSATVMARSPRLLLVDDNNVNLRLLNAFMRKRGYTDIYLASDGSSSVSIYNQLIAQTPPAPPDIIFMDISMPIMNGFEATRRIREAEAKLRASYPSSATASASSSSQHQQEPTPATGTTAMIIALTGLANGRDQSEAFLSGFDLYLIKPISFKSVAKLLDSWERNGGAAPVAPGSGNTSIGAVAGGAVTGGAVTGGIVAVGMSHGVVSDEDVASLGAETESLRGGTGKGTVSGGDPADETQTEDESDEYKDNIEGKR
jgi:signal transduction histidine kinase/DNA-binding response OmpR family regulator